MEHTFEFVGHERVWDTFSPFTPEEIMELDSYCAEHFIEQVSNLNSFGHLGRWLSHAEYKHLAECDPPFIHSSGIPMQEVIAPTQEGLEFVESLYEEFLPNFTARKLNVGCDETVELGKGRSTEECAQKGESNLYLEFLSKLSRIAGKRGFKIQFWGDIIMNQPELIPCLPPEITALEWGYEYDHPFAEDTLKFKESGIAFFVCPGTSTWQSILGRTSNMIGNIRNAVVNGVKNGAAGLLLTDWGDCGHHQYYPVSWSGITMGGGTAWNADSTETEQMLAYGISVAFAPGAEGERLGRFLLDIGLLYDDFTTRTGNSTPFGQVLPSYRIRMRKSQNCFLCRMMHSEVKKAMVHTLLLKKKLFAAPFAAYPLENAELDNALNMALSAMEFLNRALGGKWDKPKWNDEMLLVIARHEELWLARNRSGGLYESSTYLRNAMEYDPDEWKEH